MGIRGGRILVVFLGLCLLPTSAVKAASSTSSEDSLPPEHSMIEAEPVRNSRIPLYQYLRPNLGIELSTSLLALGGMNFGAVQVTAKAPTRAVHIEFDYQPTFLQAFGVLGFGPSFGVVDPGSGTASLGSIWSAGGQIRYQARFFREQPLVPMAGYYAENIVYHINDGPTGSLLITGPMLGAYLLLNTFEPSAAAEVFANSEVLRSYIVGEYRSALGTSAHYSVNGQSVYFGLRVEM